MFGGKNMTEFIAFSAFTAGIASFFSPCLLPMIPAYIFYISGIDDVEAIKENKSKVLKRTLGFIIGFTFVFIIMGLSASYIGRIFISYRNVFLKLSGFIIIVFGLNLMGIVNLKSLSREKRFKSPRKVNGILSSGLMGMAFAGGWTPCFGPILGTILFMASLEESMIQGGVLLFIYSLGMAIPFIITAIFINKLTFFMTKYEKVLNIIPYIGGIILMVFGLLIFFDKLVIVSNLLT